MIGMHMIILVTFFAIAANWYAYKKGFFTASFQEPSSIKLKFFNVFGVFAIYFGCTFILSSLIATFYRSAFIEKPILMMNWVQILTMSISIVFLFIFARTTIDKSSLFKIWKDLSYRYKKPILHDIGLGFLTWILAFPIVVVLGELSDLFIYYVFGVENYEQVAVVYLKMTSQYPSLLFIALFIILVAAPCIEEFLFRGIFQNWLRQYLGPKAAILLSSLGFAFFHMAPSQGWGNISLVISLFVFACFLGFVYEKQRSLFASIGLHIAFNAVSTFRILLMAES